MSNENEKEILLALWVKLEEMKNLTSAMIKGLEFEIKLEEGEMRNVLNAIKKMIEEIISEISENIN